MYNIPQPLFLLCPSSTTFPPSKAHHNLCTTFLGHFVYSGLPLQQSLHRKPIITHVQHSTAIFFYPTYPLQPSLHRKPITTHVQLFPAICFYFAYPLQPSLHRKPSKTLVQRSSAICSALPIPTYPADSLPLLHRKPINDDPCTTIFSSTDFIPCVRSSLHFFMLTLPCKILQLPLQSSGSLSTDADYKLFKSMSTSSLMVEL